jgi:hypothetical protein
MALSCAPIPCQAGKLSGSFPVSPQSALHLKKFFLTHIRQHASGCGFGPSLPIHPYSTLNGVRTTQSRSLGITNVCILIVSDGVVLFRVDPASSAPVLSSSMITAGSPAHPRFDSPSSPQEPPSLGRVQARHASKFCVPGPEERRIIV